MRKHSTRAARISSLCLLGISAVALSLPVIAQVSTPDAPPIPRQGDPRADTPIKDIPRPIIGALRKPYRELPQIENFEVVGYNKIPNPGDTRPRGRNGPSAIAGDCLYVGNRIGRRTGTGGTFGTPPLDPEIAIINIRNPSNPRIAGYITGVRGATSREIRTIPDRNTLIVMNFEDDLEEEPSLNSYQIYDTSNCRAPVLVQTVDMGDQVPHEFFVWRDPNNSGRFLLYTSFSGGPEPSLRVFALTNPPSATSLNPNPVATFSLSPAVPFSEPTDRNLYRDDHHRFTNKPTNQNNGLHSMAVSNDGTRVYMSNGQAGYFILDSTLLAQAGSGCTPNTVTVDATSNLDMSLCLRKINPDPRGGTIDVSPPWAGIHHSIYPVPGRPNPITGQPQYAIAFGERNGTTTCPWTPGRILDIWNEANPVTMSVWMLPENLPENCFSGGPGDPNLWREFSTHQTLVFPNLFFQSWYSGGFRAWDISLPQLPMEVGVFVPRPARNVVEVFRTSRDVWIWPFPILHNGLLYVIDESSGLYILRYTGPRANELPQQGTVLSNTNYLRAD